MKTATIYSVCECQARLGAEIDTNHLTLRGWARDPKRGEELTAPANAMRPSGRRFDVGWSCPFCTRNTLRSFESSALVYRESGSSV